MGAIGFFGGSFDPVHLGHIHVATGVLEKFRLQRVILSPNCISPFEKELTSSSHRLAMVRLASEGIVGLEVDDSEVKRGGVSYTIEALRNVQERYPKTAVRLILASDLLESFSKWKEYRSIIQEFSPICIQREAKVYVMEGIEMVFLPRMEISSTLVRERLRRGLPCDHLIPAPVASYIAKNKLYTE